jgi:hypothetical protein
VGTVERNTASLPVAHHYALVLSSAFLGNPTGPIKPTSPWKARQNLQLDSNQMLQLDVVRSCEQHQGNSAPEPRPSMAAIFERLLLLEKRPRFEHQANDGYWSTASSAAEAEAVAGWCERLSRNEPPQRRLQNRRQPPPVTSRLR